MPISVRMDNFRSRLRIFHVTVESNHLSSRPWHKRGIITIYSSNIINLYFRVPWWILKMGVFNAMIEITEVKDESL